MKRIIINEVYQLEEKLTAYIAMLDYRYKNLCVKAEEMSLLPVKITIEGTVMKIEDVALVTKKNDYQFMIIPKMEEDLWDTSKAIAMEHPEFKQSPDKLTVDTVDAKGQPTQQDVPFILVTMPEVDDDRYDVLMNGVDALYQATKTQIDAANIKADQKFASYLLSENPDTADKLKSALDKMRDEKNQILDKLKEEKQKEIEDAHNKWLAKQAERQHEEEERKAAQGDGASTSMRMDQNDDY